MSGDRIVSKDLRPLSPWTTLATKKVTTPPDSRPREYHSLVVNDYVTILAVTSDGKIPLVRQYRPALERVTLELPGGLRDDEEDPAACAARELEEETGFRSVRPLTLLGTLCPDSGRLENQLWCYYASPIEAVTDWRSERGVERILMIRDEFLDAIRAGTFTMALHIAVTALAILNKKL